MAYIRTWNKGIPVGGDAASLIWQFIENVREDVEDRATTYFTGWSTASPTDPIVAKPAISGALTGKTFYLDAADFTPYNSILANVNLDLGLGGTKACWRVNTNGYTAVFIGAFSLGIGAIIQNAKLLGLGSATSNMKIQLFHCPFTTVAPARVQLGSDGNFAASATWQIVPIGGAPVGYTVATLDQLFVVATVGQVSGASIGFSGAEITYDVTDSTDLL